MTNTPKSLALGVAPTAPLSTREKAEKLAGIRAVLADRLRKTRDTERRQRAVVRAAH